MEDWITKLPDEAVTFLNKTTTITDVGVTVSDGICTGLIVDYMKPLFFNHQLNDFNYEKARVYFKHKKQ